MWSNYLKKTGLVAESFEAVDERLQQFLLPCLNEAKGSQFEGDPSLESRSGALGVKAIPSTPMNAWKAA
jgi:hypothetical protein